MLNIEIDLRKQMSNLAMNILDHFRRYVDEELDFPQTVTITDEVVVGGKLRVDFAFLKTKPEVFIEVDGIQHKKAVKHWGGEEGLFTRQVNDRNKESFLVIKFPDHIFIRFDHNYIDFEQFLKKIEPYNLKEIFEKGDVQKVRERKRRKPKRKRYKI